MHQDVMIEMPDQFVSKSQFIGRHDIKEINDLLISLPDQFATDFQQGKFKEFTPYTTSAGILLNSIEEAIAFNNFHEGIHLGCVLAQKKVLFY